MEQSSREKEIELVARAMAESEGDVINDEWPGPVTKRLWMARAKIAVEVIAPKLGSET